MVSLRAGGDPLRVNLYKQRGGVVHAQPLLHIFVSTSYTSVTIFNNINLSKQSRKRSIMRPPGRDRIKFPSGDGFPRIGWNSHSGDYELGSQEIVNVVLDSLGDLVDVIEEAFSESCLQIKWNQLNGLLGTPSPALPDVTALVNFVIQKANSISAAYSGAVKRRSRVACSMYSSLYHERKFDILACKCHPSTST
jgi:hypothetical protein